MKKIIFLALTTLFFSSPAISNELDNIRDIERTTEKFKEISISCLIEIKAHKAKTWETRGSKSKACEKYKAYAKNEIKSLKSKAQKAIDEFKAYSKSGDASKRRIQRGLKSLILIQENIKSIKNIGDDIKSESKTKE